MILERRDRIARRRIERSLERHSRRGPPAKEARRDACHAVGERHGMQLCLEPPVAARGCLPVAAGEAANPTQPRVHRIDNAPSQR
jgi:hypothetical protein